jgi:hypothetical protein
MRQRCLDPNHVAFKHYGARGITIAPEWINDFAAYRDCIKENLGPRPSPKHTIDRTENHEGYFPGNLQWATQSQQLLNSRRSKLNKRLNALLLECITDL